MLDSISNFYTAKGRSGRLRYFYYIFMANAFFFISELFVKDDASTSVYISLLSISILIIIKNICVTIQRLHDLARSGYHIFLFLIPLYNIYLSLVLLFKEGSREDNIYGRNPLIEA